MHQKPVLLRRTGSSLPGSSSHGVVTPAADPGTGGQVDPDSGIPIADEEPGDMNQSTHKRKQSGIPLEAEAIIGRASVQTSLERIRDEEEGSVDQMGGIALSRSNSDASGIPSSPRSSMPDFADIYPENEGRLSLRSLMTPRGLALAGFLVLAVGYVMTNGSSSHHTPAAGTSPAADLSGNQAQSPGSKEITVGEYHDEEVGEPMQHSPREYNKIIFYESPDRMEPIISKGPVSYSDTVGGLHLFENVCLTTNIDALRYRPDPDSGLRGLIFFTDEEKVMNNPKRCVPCSNREEMGEWDNPNHKDSETVGHQCGMNGLHAMYASSVGDWSDCIMEDENAKLMEDWGQTQSPVDVSTIHFFQEPTFVLQFDENDMEKSLFDMLLTYLPHWDDFLGGGSEARDGEEGFPFRSVISHSLQGCLSHSHNWFCEVLHQMYAFGEAKEIPWEEDENTLYCYRELYYNQVGYNRNLDHEGLLTRETFGEFREILFRKFGLPRRRTVKDREAEAEEEKAHGKNGDDDGDDTKIIFYDNKLSERTVWNEMESLISKARELEKFSDIKFVTVKDFGGLSVAQQARKFNQADAVIMAHGSHMANAIFAVDGTTFVEVGCKVESLVGNPHFMEMMDGKYRAVEKCDDAEDGEEESVVCVKCTDDINFTMTLGAFEKLIDDVVAGLEG